jgi:hypothetical protein
MEKIKKVSLLRLQRYHDSFEHFCEDLLGLRGDVFEGVSICGTPQNMAAIAVWCAWFTQDYTIAVDCKHRVHHHIMEFVDRIHSLFPNDMESSISYQNHNSFKFTNGSTILIINSALFVESIHGRHIDSVISDKCLLQNTKFVQSVYPVLNSYHREGMRVIDVQEVKMHKAIFKLVGQHNAKIATNIIRGRNKRPLLEITVYAGRTIIYQNVAEKTMFRDDDLMEIALSIKENIAYKLDLLDL